jgi:hypothetical protein
MAEIEVYEKLKAAALADLERYNDSPIIQKALSVNLSNESEETDYGLWSKGCDDFAKDNMAVLAAWAG